MAFHISFFKAAPHRVFNYIPRSYDPDTEKLKERERKTRSLQEAAEEDSQKPYVAGSTIRGSFSKNYHYTSKRALPKYSGAIRWIVILMLVGLLIGIVYAINLGGHVMSLVK